jgi:hypothetical protein
MAGQWRRENLKNIRNSLRPVWFAGSVLIWLLGANLASADTISDTADTSALDDGTGDLPLTDLSGWFFNLDPQLPFPAEPDPSQSWTSPANIATLDYWLSVVSELGDDPSLLAQLYGLGMINSPDPAAVMVSEVSTEESPSDVPEPGTPGLFIGGLALLGVYATQRARRLRNGLIPAAIIGYGPL